MIDTHAHIYLSEFDEDRTAVIDRAKAVGVKHIILPNVDSQTIDSLIKLETSIPNFFHAAMGLHPTSVKSDWENELDIIKTQIDNRSFCAIGEIGIDLYWDKTYLKEQLIVFEKQLEWAINLNLPVIIHVREAFAETLASVKKMNCKALRGVFHSFGGSLAEAEAIIELGGFKLGINGVITFKNSSLKDYLASIPLEMLVLETDAPYLTPVPFRGKRNEPMHLLQIAEKLADIYKETTKTIREKTYENSLEIFNSI